MNQNVKMIYLIGVIMGNAFITNTDHNQIYLVSINYLIFAPQKLLLITPKTYQYNIEKTFFKRISYHFNANLN